MMVKIKIINKILKSYVATAKISVFFQLYFIHDCYECQMKGPSSDSGLIDRVSNVFKNEMVFKKSGKWERKQSHRIMNTVTADKS